ncbi:MULTISPECIES: carbohydrate ABC transporter permease [unclassified Streptomyces]|uniref:carbohydrate ABC transporter permease n=2 Tax=Streptomyces TaxID=1883 RepID=UPI0022AF58B5|nr:sugar ABC transporter permease [Streptomyces sp. H39-C1]MCZ4101445.1 sugar ABC transporter permease [Streptomyces sp. H39-C1]
MAVPLARTPRRRAAARPGQRGAVTVLLVPFFALFGLVMVAPIGYAVWMSLFQERSSGLGFGGTERVFSGLGNYSRALSDPAFRTSFLHIAVYCVAYIPVMIGGALVLALLLDSALSRAKRFLQLALFLPHAVPSMIAAIIWIYLYTPGLSPVTGWIESLGGNWAFFSADHALSSMINIAVWQWIGYNMVIFYAALQAVPRETLEAAVVDGAGELRIAWQIKVPVIRSSVVLTLLFTCVGAVQLFNEPKILSSRASSLGSTWSPTMYIFKAAFERHDYGLAAASSLLLALAAAALSFIVTRIGNRGKTA